jgi:hypothetical protein
MIKATLLDDTVVAKADSQELLHALMEQKATGMISEYEWEQSILREVHEGRMFYTGHSSFPVQLTEKKPHNSLLEFKVKGNDTLFYAYARAFCSRQRC